MKIELLIRKYWITKRDAVETSFDYPDDPDTDSEIEAEKMQAKILEYYELPNELYYQDFLNTFY